jgi:hypothetical protein
MAIEYRGGRPYYCRKAWQRGRSISHDEYRFRHWVNEGRPYDRHLDNWLAAESELGFPEYWEV